VLLDDHPRGGAVKIVMMTNTYAPHVGGVARSVAAFTNSYRARGHRVVVVCPIFEGAPARETDVIRIPALQKFNGSDFSVVLPVPGDLTAKVRELEPDVIHAHHPFLLGSAALRLARAYRIPMVFTHHTMYERYTHYVPGDSPALKRFVISLSTSFANLCDMVFAPSESMAREIAQRGVTAPVEVVPTGVDTEALGSGDGPAFRAEIGIPEDAFVVGHLGRLAPEKNLPFLTRAVARFLAAEPRARFLVVGVGPSADDLKAVLRANGLEGRLHTAGILKGRTLVNAYHAMDAFAFASLSETQGLVVAEAMAAGVPVVALDAPGVREVVVDGENGRILPAADEAAFADALAWIAGRGPEGAAALRGAALATAGRFSLVRTADLALAHYERLRGHPHEDTEDQYDAWDSTLRMIRAEWEMLKDLAEAAGAALKEGGERAP
jgi:1,2-diacylglycerol 3-alpha-glucosyltransferase